MRVSAYGFILALFIAPAPALSSCFSELNRDDAPFTWPMYTDAKLAIEPLLAALEARRAGTADGPAIQLSVAHLYAILMDAYDDSGDVDKAAEASRLGIVAINADDSAGLRRRLQMTGLLIQDEMGHITEAETQVELITADMPVDVPDRFCVMLQRGHIRKRAGHKVAATTDFMQAFHLAQRLGEEKMRIHAGLELASIYSQYKLFAEAHALEDDAIRYYSATNDKEGLGFTYLYQGSDYLDQDDLGQAEAQLLKAKSYYRDIGSLADEAVPQVLLCQTLVRVPYRPDARDVCREADRDAAMTQYPEGQKQVLGSLGELELREGRPVAAIALFDRVLADDKVEITARLRARFQSLRGQARAQLHNFAGALEDINQYVAWLKEDQESSEEDRLAILRVRFESALNQEELLKAKAEALASESRAAREALLRNTVVISTVSMFVVAVLIAIFWRRRVTLMSSRRAAEERLAALGRLTGGIAHEFNNMLTVMMQSLGQLDNRLALTEETRARELVHDLQVAARASAEITAQLQSFGRQQNLRPQAIDMRTFLDALLPMLGKAAGNSVKVDVSTDTSTLRAWVDDRLLGSAILNLVINARDAMPHGGQIGIHACSDSGNRVKIDIEDNGSGMSPEVLKHAIEPFYSTKAVGTGSGLGLSMVNGFVTQSGGSMQIHSELHVGTTVTLWIPAAEDPP